MYELQQRLSWSALKAGRIISIALLVLFFTIFFSGNITGIFVPQTRVTANVGNVSGLRPGAPVWLYGVEIGTVSRIKITDKGTIITLSIKRRYEYFIKTDSRIVVNTMGLLGDKYVEIIPGSPDAVALSSRDTLSGTGPVQIDRLLSSGESSITQLNHIIAMLDSFVVELRQGQGSLEELIENPQLYNQLTEASRQISIAARQFTNRNGSLHQFAADPQLYENLNNASRQLSSILTGVDSGSGIAGSVLRETETTRKFREVITNVNNLILDIQNNPRKYLTIKIF